MTKDKSRKEKQVDNVICEGCGKKIPKARLHVLPNTRYCVKCQQEYEVDNPVDGSIYLTEPDAAELTDIISPDD